MRLSESELARRGNRIQQLLRPISPWRSGPACSRLAVSPQVIIGTHDKAPPTSHYRDWRFTVNAKRHHAMYFEAWRSELRNRFVLAQAYLNIYEKIGTNQEKEIVCLHCDPSLLADADHVRYKRGPHIHMSVAGFPYDRAHIALHGPDLTSVLRSTDSLHSALEWGVEMIRDEILVLAIDT